MGKKYAIKKVTFQGDVRKAIRHKRPPIYDKELVKILVTLWKVSGHLCGKRLKPFIKDNIDSIKKNLHPSLKQSQLLEKISAATIDRLLTDERERVASRKNPHESIVIASCKNPHERVYNFLVFFERRLSYISISILN